MDLWTNAATLIDSSAVFLLTVAIKGALILSLAALINTLALRKAAAALRHLVWTLALVAIVLVPALTPLTPRWAAPGMRELEPAARAQPETVAPEPTPPAPERVMVQAEPSPEEPPAASAGVVPRSDQGRRGATAAPTGFAADVAPETSRSEVRYAEPQRSGGVPVGVWLVTFWVAGFLAVCSWIVVGLLRAWRLGRDADEVKQGPLLRILERLSAELGLRRPVRLLSAHGRMSPMTWGVLRPAILLPRAASGWPAPRLRAVLLHELSHVKRHDCAIQLVARLACALHWFNPLVWIAAARLKVERELACDDAVLRAGSLPSDYATHLLEIATSQRSALLAGAAVPMARGTGIADRLRGVLDAKRRRHAVTGRVAVPSGLGAAALALVVAGAAPAVEDPGARVAAEAEPAPVQSEIDPDALNPRPEEVVAGRPAVDLDAAVQDCDWLGAGGSASTSINVNDDDWRAKIRRKGCELTIEISGDAAFNEEETDIVALSAGGLLEIEEREGRRRRRLVVDADRSGQLERRWYVDGDERAFDADARAWLGEMILVLFRRVGYQAQERAERILAARGVDGLLQEISHIPSDHTARRYYTVLLAQGDLGPEQVRAIVSQVGEQIESDHELASLLVAIAEQHPLEESVKAAYVEATGSLDSDFEHRRALSAVLERDDLSPELARAMLEQAARIDSDHEVARLLLDILAKRPLQREMLDPFFAAVERIGSDFERRRVLHAAIQGSDANQELLDRSLRAAQNISSDFELARLLIGVAERYPLDRTLPPTYLAAARSIGSDHELARVLTTLVSRDDLGAAVLVDLLDVAREIDSDFEAARLLMAVVRERELDDMTRRAFFALAERIESDFERRRVLAEVLDGEQLDRATVEAVLDAALDIGSDHELANLLMRVADRFPVDDELRPAFLRAADTIGSDYERNRVLALVTPGAR